MTSSYSVVIPAYNAAETLRAAILSIEAQTRPAKEIIVVDDGSTDDTAAIAAAMTSVTLIKKPNGGPGSATSAGIEQVQTPYFATLDSDDLWLPHKMETQFALMNADQSLSACFARASLFRHEIGPEQILPIEPVRLWTRTTMVFRTKDAHQIGAMRDFPGYLGDLVDWFGRSKELGQNHIMLDDILALRRIRRGSLSDTRESPRLSGYLHAAYEAIKRRQNINANAK